LQPLSLLKQYDRLAAGGQIERDLAQVEALRKLEKLANGLPKKRRQSRLAGWGSHFFSVARGEKSRSDLRGLYLWGAVGRGKTTLMDLFFTAIPLTKKRRVHFHAFMADVHMRLHIKRQKGECTRDPVAYVGEDLARECEVLCFDEFNVNDIADATILARLFKALFDAGVIVVATSNVEPQHLYEGGRNRELFLPFIELLRARMDVIELTARTDYRLEKHPFRQVYFSPADTKAKSAIDAQFLELTGRTIGEETAIDFQRRRIRVPEAAGCVARFDFADICGSPLGAGDYLALAKRFKIFIVESVPRLDFDRRNEARRLITLVDVLYDARRRLVISAECEAKDIYFATQGAEAQEFQRTVSRLREMCSAEWLAAWREMDEAAAL
jgi:cell division protein ZapE